MRTAFVLIFLSAIGARAAVFSVTTNADSGTGSLRAAIQSANTSPAPNTISFLLSPSRIAPATPLPAITNAVILDGTTHPAYLTLPVVAVDGKALAGNSPAFTVQGSGIVIRGIEICSFTGTGVQVTGTSNTIEACEVRSNAQYGIAVNGSWNIVGGVTNPARNIIHENAAAGVSILGGTGNRVLANWIGPRIGPALSAVPPASLQGVGVRVSGGTGTILDGATNGSLVISGNGTGVELSGASRSNVVRGCWFGLDHDGTGLVANVDHLVINGPSYGNTIGSTGAPWNVFGPSSNAAITIASASNTVVAGNWIGVNRLGFGLIANDYGVRLVDATDNQVGADGITNLIVRCAVAAISISGASSNNLVSYNQLGAVYSSPNWFAVSNNIGVLVSAAHNAIGPGNIIAGSQVAGVLLDGAGAFDNDIAGNWIGTLEAGVGLFNPGCGIVLSNAPLNRIGDGTPAGRNIIVHSIQHGILLSGSGCTSNAILGNWIGVKVDGSVPGTNRNHGIYVLNAPRNRIGQAGGVANVISASGTNGIFISGAAGNSIVNSIIGLDASATGTVGNGGNGIELDLSPATRIGGTSPLERNYISGNHGYGIRVGPGAYSNWISTSHIGVRTNGLAGPNDLGGVRLESWGNLVGGPGAGYRNVVAGNDGPGVLLIGGVATNNTLQNNYIGINPSGLFAQGNNGDGVRVQDGASSATIGAAGAGNLIGGNASNGVYISGITTRLARVAGNWIGTYADGVSIGGRNNQFGIRLRNTADHTIGGLAADEGNLISGNRHGGVMIDGTSSLIRVYGNRIGTDFSGTLDLGNGTNGVTVLFSGTNRIGIAGAGNLISGNETYGIQILASAHNLVEANRIGTQEDGIGRLENGLAGVLVGSSDNTIGGSNSASGNRIGWHTNFPASFGVGVGISAIRVPILGNVVFSNRVDIDLADVGGFGAPNPNDPAPDSDSGANQLQNYPVITGATQGSTAISGYLASSNSTTFRVEFMATEVAQGGAFLGATNVTSGPTGTGAFSVTWAYALPAGARVQATATDPAGNTSEMSPGATNQPAVDIDGDGMPDAWELAQFGSLTNGANGDVDGDGQRNYAEYVTMTEPTNGASLFEIDAITHAGPTGLVAVLAAAPGRFHQLQFATDLISSTNWIATGPERAGDGGQLILPDSTVDFARSYRVNVRLP